MADDANARARCRTRCSRCCTVAATLAIAAAILLLVLALLVSGRVRLSVHLLQAVIMCVWPLAWLSAAVITAACVGLMPNMIRYLERALYRLAARRPGFVDTFHLAAATAAWAFTLTPIVWASLFGVADFTASKPTGSKSGSRSGAILLAAAVGACLAIGAASLYRRAVWTKGGASSADKGVLTRPSLTLLYTCCMHLVASSLLLAWYAWAHSAPVGGFFWYVSTRAVLGLGCSIFGGPICRTLEW